MKFLQFFLLFLFNIHFAYALDINVGSENAYKPFAYLDEKGAPTGFDNEAVKIVAAYIPQAKVKFSSLTWNAIFSGLDSGKFDVVANQIAKTKEREEKYLFSKEPYFYGVSALILGKNEKIKDFSSLNGQKIGATMGSNHAKNLENYKANHPETTFEIVYYKTSPALVADLANGRLSAIINDPISTLDFAKAQNVQVYPTDVVLEKTPIYFVFRKDSAHLLQVFDQALEQALKDGKISELSVRYFGKDFSR